MKSRGGSDTAKRRAGERAARAVEDGMVVGLGTGSTAAHAVRALGRAVDDGLSVRGIPTSAGTRALAVRVGLDLAGLDEVEGRVDLAIDGADQVAGSDLLKGGGAAHAREKVVAAAADRVLVVVDETKLTQTLAGPVPVEVLPEAVPVVTSRVERLGGDPDLRAGGRKDGPLVTDNGNLILDCAFGQIESPSSLAADLDPLPGVVAHGLFVDAADEVYVGTDEDVTVNRM